MSKYKKTQKIIKVASRVFAITGVIFPLYYSSASASHLGSGGSTATHLENPLTVSTFQCFVEEVLQVVMLIGTPVVVLAIIYSGFLFVTAQGNEDKLTIAKKAFMWSVIGGAVLLGSWALAQAIGATISAIGAPSGVAPTC